MLAFSFLSLNNQLSGQNIPNPVLPGVADAGVIKYNGKYYIGGVFTDGDFYVSKDLVNWEGPVHVFDMDNDWTKGTQVGNDQIHANDMIYHNGEFHLYWSVNHWGQDKHIVHIGHATSNHVLGPYIEPIKDTWLDSRIDPQVFKDDDGKFYMYMVRFSDGNTIWARPMRDPYSFSGKPVYQFASLPHTWETYDSRVAEGPWVIKYRDRYYMMYNANDTNSEKGNYQLGVAEANSPTTFSNGNKYSYPLLLSNQISLEEEYTDLLKFNKGSYDPVFNYTTVQPQGDWKQLEYNDSSWQKGKGGFSDHKIVDSTVRPQETVWEASSIYLRKKFHADSSTGNIALRITHDGDTKVFLNGQLIYDRQGADYIMHHLTEKDKSALVRGENVIAIISKKGKRNYIDVSLFDLKEETADDILFSPGQPNIVRGPNGFEWWLVYMANKNNEQRSQYINRIYFHNKTMHAGRITSTRTKGYLPAPTYATFSDAFDDADFTQKRWSCHPAAWRVTNEEFCSPRQTSTAILDKQQASDTYLFESGVKTNGKAGIIAWWKDSRNWMKIGLSAQGQSWYVEESINGITNVSLYPLPDDFKFNVYHSISIERNSHQFNIKIDGIPAPGLADLKPSYAPRGVPGLFTEEGTSYFDGVTFTIGWDEFDQGITAWKGALSGEKAKGEYTVDSKGLTTSGNEFQAFKGDPLSQYEVSVQITNQDEKGIAGAYPVYTDNKNYVKTGFDFHEGRLTVTQVVNGKTAHESKYDLENWKTHYADIKYTDFIKKGYSFEYPTWINGIQLNRISYDNQSFTENMFEKMNIEYMCNEKWYPLPISGVTEADNPLYNQTSFNPVRAEALRFVNKEAQDLNRYIYKTRVHEQFKSSFNLRCVKLTDSILILVDGEEICRLNDNGKPAQVGLYSNHTTAIFNGILRYHIP